MSKTVIIIPSRLAAKRLPNKPLMKIKGIPMIVRVLNKAKESKVGEVYVATPDSKIIDMVKKNGGKTIKTKNDHPNGTLRIFEAFTKLQDKNVDLIINLQGDQPLLSAHCIKKLVKLMNKNTCQIGTLASLLNKNEIYDKNIVKVKVEKQLKEDSFLKAKDFFRAKKGLLNKNVYHHIGIYAFTKYALTKYVKLSRSKLEIKRNLEQMRAMENNMKIKVGLSNSIPLSIDIEKDLKYIEKIIN